MVLIENYYKYPYTFYMTVICSGTTTQKNHLELPEVPARFKFSLHLK